jgi:CDP-diacylglycerol--serine O-phosphatidyltransferase
MPQQDVVPHRKVRFVVVNGFTAASLILGFASLIFTTAGFLTTAACCLLASVLLDGCDGTLARRWRVASSFGAQLDSMADMTAFGVAAAALSYYWLMDKDPTQPILIAVAACLIALTGAIRLARFNVTPKNEAYFQGIPTTFAAAAIAIIYLTTPNLNILWGALLVTSLALLMVSAFPYAKWEQVRQLPKWLLLVGVIGALVNPSATSLTLASAYICSGPVLWLRRRVA